MELVDGRSSSSCCCYYFSGSICEQYVRPALFAPLQEFQKNKRMVSRDLQHQRNVARRSLCIHNWWTPGAAEKGATSTSDYSLSLLNHNSGGALYPTILNEGSGSPYTRDNEGLLILDSLPCFSMPKASCFYPLACVESTIATHEDDSNALMHNSMNLTDLKICSGVGYGEYVESTLVSSENDTTHLMSSDIIFARLQQCIDTGDLVGGREIHQISIVSGYDSDSFLGSHLIRMFANFDCLTEAIQVFHRLPHPSVYSWNSIMLAHVKFRQYEAAMQLYHKVENSSLDLDGYMFVGALKACTNLPDVDEGMLIHAQVIESGVEFDDYVSTALVEMYSKCETLEVALNMFNRLPMWRSVSCSLLIGGYIEQGQESLALQLFGDMIQKGVKPDEVTYISILKACSNLGVLKVGWSIHALLIESGLDCNICVGNAILDVYCKCQSLQEARAVFNKLPVQDVVTWTTLVAGYAQHGFSQKALQFFEAMEHHGFVPNWMTLVLVLRACSHSAALEQGRKIHARLVESGTELDEFAGSSLIDMYGKCGSIGDADIMFGRLPAQSVVSWSSLIAGFAKNGQSRKAYLLFEQMQGKGVTPDDVAFVCILKACSGADGLERGRQVHGHLLGSGFGTDLFLGNALIDMYVNCESMEDALSLSNRLPEQTLVTWSVLIGGYVQQGLALEALQIFDKMIQEGVELDEVSFVCALKACSSIAALKQGRQIHARVLQKGYELDSHVRSALINMYGKCGSLKDACRDFERLPKRSVVTWSALMSGYAHDGDYPTVARCFEDMLLEGVQPDDVSFLSLLAACSHRGLVETGWTHFKSMRDDHNIEPTNKHYNSMVDILGYAGHLNVAEDLLETIPIERNLVGWTSLLMSCRRHWNASIGLRSFDNLIAMDRGNAAGYVLMGNIYSQAGRWKDAEEIEELRRCANGWKKPGKAFIEIGDQVLSFGVADTRHPQSDAIYAKLEGLDSEMKEEGYEPRLDLVLDGLSEDDKVDALCGHCEKLAIAFGLISTPQGTTIRVSKNLRMCVDCHNATKIISKVERREIIVVDAYCVHHFEGGTCSCPEFA